MAIIRWQPASPFEELNRMRQEMDRLFRDYSGGADPFFSRALESKETKEMELKKKKEVQPSAGESTRPGPVFIPAVDILETTNEIVVLADMPGVESKNVDIDLKDNQLTIRGHIDPVVGEKETPLYSEFSWGDYFRTFTLSEVIDQEKITAKMDQGVFRLALPKVEKVKPRKIAVSAD